CAAPAPSSLLFSLTPAHLLTPFRCSVSSLERFALFISLFLPFCLSRHFFVSFSSLFLFSPLSSPLLSSFPSPSRPCRCLSSSSCSVGPEFPGGEPYQSV